MTERKIKGGRERGGERERAGGRKKSETDKREIKESERWDRVHQEDEALCRRTWLRPGALIILLSSTSADISISSQPYYVVCLM